MKVTCVDIPVEFKLTYDRERRQISPTKLPAAVKREVRMAYGDPTRAGDAAPLAVYYTTDRAGYRLPKKLPCGSTARSGRRLCRRALQPNRELPRLHGAVSKSIVLERDQRVSNPNYLGDRAVTAISAALTTFLGGFENLRVQEEPLRLLVDKDGVALDLIATLGRRAFVPGADLRLGPAAVVGKSRCLRIHCRAPGVVLIDELELHLHPKWQREVRRETSRRLSPTFSSSPPPIRPLSSSRLRAGRAYQPRPRRVCRVLQTRALRTSPKT